MTDYNSSFANGKALVKVAAEKVAADLIEMLSPADYQAEPVRESLMKAIDKRNVESLAATDMLENQRLLGAKAKANAADVLGGLAAANQGANGGLIDKLQIGALNAYDDASDMVSAAGDKLDELKGAAAPYWNKGKELAAPAVAKALEITEPLADKAKEIAAPYVGQANDYLTSAYARVLEATGDHATAAKAAVLALMANPIEAGQDMYNLAKPYVDQGMQKMVPYANDARSIISDGLKQLMAQYAPVEAAPAAAPGMVDDLVAKATALGKAHPVASGAAAGAAGTASLAGLAALLRKGARR